MRLHTSSILSANQRLHWRKEAELKQTLVAFGRLALGRGMKPTREKVRVTFEFTFPTRRRRDRANFHPTCKALLDGIVRAGVLVDDSDGYVDGPDIVVRDGVSGEPDRVLVRVVLEDQRSLRRARLAEAEAEIMRERDRVEAARALAKAASRARTDTGRKRGGVGH